MKHFNFGFLLLTGFFMLMNSQLMAKPAKPDPVTIHQLDGTEITLRLKGDANLTPSDVRFFGDQTATRGQGSPIFLSNFKLLNFSHYESEIY